MGARDRNRRRGGKNRVGGNGKKGSSSFTEFPPVEKEVLALDRRIAAEAPAPGKTAMEMDAGVNPDRSGATSAAQSASQSESEKSGAGKRPKPRGKLFSSLPISKRTLAGLTKGNFTNMTAVQSASIPHALAGRDIIAAAKTGSGKTLAFLIPAVEALYRAGWDAGSGLGGLIISPTRELALQIFEVLRVVGRNHDLSAGLVIGGNDLKQEQRHIMRMNVLVSTPGRLLQHLEQTYGFACDDLMVLVLDEADRILDMGFSDQMNAILEYVPLGSNNGGSRQTLLFSATMSTSVKRLVEKLGISSSAERIRVHEMSNSATPTNLEQLYMVCELPDKLNVLYSFIRTHLKSKMIVFFSSCQQVKFVDAAFRRLRPGVPLMALHGKIKQARRMHIYYNFVEKPAAVLFATDIASRGLDFPAVDWVLQFDCPEDTKCYIHRVGRTARYKSKGKALTLLLPTEAPAMSEQFKKARIPMTEIFTNPARQQKVSDKLMGEIAKDPELKITAQKAFKSYVRSVHLQPNKEAFDAKKLPLAAFAASLGLNATPRVRLGDGSEASREVHRRKKNESKALAKLRAMDADEAPADIGTMGLLNKLRKKEANPEKKTKWEKLLSRKSEAANADPALTAKNGDDEEDDDLLVVTKRLPAFSDRERAMERLNPVNGQSVRSRKRIRLDAQGNAKSRIRGTKTLFGDDGEAMTPFARMVQESKERSNDTEGTRTSFVDKIAAKLAAEDEHDRDADRERLRERRLKKKLKAKAREMDKHGSAAGGAAVATLGGGGDSNDSESDANDAPEMDETTEAERLALAIISGTA